MPPELVVKAQQTIEDFISSNLTPQFDDLKYLSELIYDLSLPLAVFDFHSQRTRKHETFTSFFREYLNTTFLTYPLFLNLIKHIEMLNTYFSTFPNLNKIEILGDVHSKCTKFKYNDRILYQNVFGYEEIFNNLTKEFEEFSQIFPKFDVKKSYIARHFVEAQNNDVKLEDFYYNIGKFFTYAMFFRMIDLHQENVIIRDNLHLFSFDIESTFTPEYESAPYGLKVTGLVSGQTDDNNSALFGGMFKINSYLKPIFAGTEQDPQVSWQTTSKRKFLNMPNTPVTALHPYLFYEQIRRGVHSAVHYLDKHKDSIIEIVSQHNDFKFRLITRPTRIYKYILYDYAYNQKDFKSDLDVKNYYSKLLKEANQLKCGEYTDSMLEHEIEELQQLSIPISLCSFNTSNIYTDGHKITGALHKSPKEWFLLHANTFNDFMLQQLQELHEILSFNYNSTNKR